MTKTIKLVNNMGGDDAKFILLEDYVQSLYAITQHWHSDAKFFEYELKFFRLLIDKHLVLMIDTENVGKTRLVVSHLVELDAERVSLEKNIALHLEHITNLVKNRFVQKLKDYSDEHAMLEVEFAAFVKKFRAAKSDIFELTERVVHADKIKRFIDRE